MSKRRTVAGSEISRYLFLVFQSMEVKNWLSEKSKVIGCSESLEEGKTLPLKPDYEY